MSGIAVPDDLPILPLRGVVIFPSAIVPLLISRGASLKLVEDAPRTDDRMLGLVVAEERRGRAARSPTASTRAAPPAAS